MCSEGLWELTCRYLAICMGVKLWSSVYCLLLRKSAMVAFITAPGLCELLRRTAKRYRSHWMSISLPDTASCTNPSINSIVESLVSVLIFRWCYTILQWNTVIWLVRCRLFIPRTCITPRTLITPAANTYYTPREHLLHPPWTLITLPANTYYTWCTE